MKKARQGARARREALPFMAPPGVEALEPGPLDRHFARLLVELHGSPAPELEIAAQMASAWRGAGHICVPLAELPLAGLAKSLRASPMVGAPGEFRPLILDSRDRLYLQRYWQYEDELARALRARLGAAAHDAALLGRALDRFFPHTSDEDAAERSSQWDAATGTRDERASQTFRGDGQRAAAEMAVGRAFCVITGGPGTGKTRTVVVVLALLIEQFLAAGRRPRIALAAPTGKAGARLQESIRQTADALGLSPEVRAAMPADATTLHRLLGARPDSPYFRHDAARPLAVDAVIVDEASMVDLALLAKLVAAVPAGARLILLGDKDQLASVESGYVLGDICQADAAVSAPPIVELRKNYRFGNESGIFRVSRAVNVGDGDAALALLREAAHADLHYEMLPTAARLVAALRRPVEFYRGFLTAADPAEALRRLQDFRILCAVRRGPFGVENVNRLVEQLLADAGLISPAGPLYAGRPVLILRNEPRLRLFNGDVGLLLADAEAGGELRAFFLDAEGALRRVLPARLPEHETAFAMTVHKSQGSEFDRVLLVLPERDTPVATRELVYTGLTRARRAVELWASEAILRAAIARRTQRASGLREALWGAA